MISWVSEMKRAGLEALGPEKLALPRMAGHRRSDWPAVRRTRRCLKDSEPRSRPQRRTAEPLLTTWANARGGNFVPRRAGRPQPRSSPQLGPRPRSRGHTQPAGRPRPAGRPATRRRPSTETEAQHRGGGPTQKSFRGGESSRGRGCDGRWRRRVRVEAERRASPPAMGR